MPLQSVMLRDVLTPTEEADLERLAREKDEVLPRFHDRIAELYENHKDDPPEKGGPVTMAYLARKTGYTEQRVQQIIAERRS